MQNPHTVRERSGGRVHKVRVVCEEEEQLRVRNKDGVEGLHISQGDGRAQTETALSCTL